MELLSLAQIFGEGAFQNENVLIINKASLLRLTPTLNNSAESLLAAVIITALTNFQGTITDENNQPITDENNQPITFDNSDAYELLKVISWPQFSVKRKNQAYLINQLIVFSYGKNQ